MKKNNFKIATLLMIISVMTTLLMVNSCDKGFEEMNINPNAYTEPDLGSLFAYSIIRRAGSGSQDVNRVNIKHLSGAMQYFSTLALNWFGEKQIINEQSGNYFEEAYRNHGHELSIVLSYTEDNPQLVNLNAMAKIWKVFILHRVVDGYGDVPYTEALQAENKIYKPKYDKQSDIYPMMLQDLEAAIKQLDASKPTIGSADIIYGGNIDKWKKFGYSFMLRLGMRLTKVDPAMAETWVKKAIAGGVIESIADQAILKHQYTNSNNWNMNAAELKRESYPEGLQGTSNIKIGTTFLDLLKAHNDPRISFYMTLWEGNIEARQLAVISETTKPELQKAIPPGYDPVTITQVIPNWSSTLMKEYSEPNMATMTHRAAPSTFMSASEVQFILAEAVLRGWKTGDAETHYHNGIRANMESSYSYPNYNIEPMYLTKAKIDAYIAAHPLNGADFKAKMEQIHTQFYLSFFMYHDYFEAWSNWRRTGIPEIKVAPYILSSTNGHPIRRLLYSVEEWSMNKENVEAAVKNQGPDSFLTRV